MRTANEPLLTEALGIIAGNRTLPLLFARQARQLGVRRLVAVAFEKETEPDLAGLVDEIIWIKVGIGRGVLECLLGLIYLAKGLVTFSQAGFGIIVAGLMALAYVLLYPRRPRLMRTTETPVRHAPSSP